MSDLKLTKEELHALIQICNQITTGSGYFYRGKTIKRNAERMCAKAIAALGTSARPEETQETQ